MTEEAALDEVALPHAALRAVAAGTTGPVLVVRRPTPRVVAFGRSEVRRPGFAAAVTAVRAHGFAPVVRSVGGRAVAWAEDVVVADLVAPDPDPSARMRARFVEAGELLAHSLRTEGVDARVGDVPGEYCPGAHSVNARGTTKLVGTAQRVVRGAWLLSAVVVTDRADALRPVLTDVYVALGQELDPGSVGAVRAEAPHLDDDAVARLVADALAPLAPHATGLVTDEVLRLVPGTRPEHAPVTT